MKKLVLFAIMGLAGLTAPAQIYINELLADNASTNTDANGEFDDWVELYNAGSQAVDLAGYYITDDPLDMVKYQIPTGSPTLTTIAPGGFLLIWCDDDGAQGPLHANFKLGAGGEFVGLSTANNQVVDSVTFNAQNPDVSYGRAQDGGSPWILFFTPTPEGTNSPVAVTPGIGVAFGVYPNPAAEFLRTTDGQAYEVLNLNGQTVCESDADGVADVRALTPGIYFVRTHLGFSSKFMKR